MLTGEQTKKHAHSQNHGGDMFKAGNLESGGGAAEYVYLTENQKHIADVPQENRCLRVVEKKGIW